MVPARLIDAGFTFDYPRWDAAAMDLAAHRRHASPSINGVTR
ncbi:DUF1731 domain-containing protein [Actinoplanes awajinensis]|nr:DUF1731 domain-containing protein [Actinoplanes awajinensis]